MSFESYIPTMQGYRVYPENCITINKTRIGLGKIELPFSYTKILFDKEMKAIRFTEGDSADGYKISKNGRTITAKSFTHSGVLPYGIYRRNEDTESYTFVLSSEYTETRS